MSLYIAGFEATATSIACVISELADHPEHQATLYTEIQTYLSGKEITIEVINDMSFLNCIVNEALRLFPAIPVVDRIAEKDFEVINTLTNY